MAANIQAESKFVSAVMYVHNDAAYIDSFLEMITKILRERFTKYELIFVNDASPDDSIAAIHDFFEEHHMDSQMVSIVQMSHYQGQETAMNAGRDIAIGDFVYEFDDMFIDYDPELIFEVYQETAAGNDVVSAGCSNATSFSSRLFYSLYNRTNHGNGSINTETFRILSRRAINRIKTIGQYIPYRKAVYMNCGLNTQSLHYVSDRAAERKKALADRHERHMLAMDSLIYFTNIMEKLSMYLSGLFGLIAVAVGADILYETVSGAHTVEGWRSTMGFLAVGFVGVFVLQTIILRYLSVLINLSYRRQRYLIAGVEKITPRKQ